MADDDTPETLRRIVMFLDIDGVLQPPSKQTRFKHDLDELRRSLAGQAAQPNRAWPQYGPVPSGLFG